MSYIRTFDYFFVLRPLLHIPVWTVLILGYYSIHLSHGYKWNLLLSLLLGSFVFGGVFLINQIYDIESDRINGKLHFLPDGHIKPGVAWLMFIVLNTTSIVGGFFVSLEVGVLIIAVMILGMLYSVPPISLKNRPWAAALSNGLGHGSLVFMVGYYAGGGASIKGVIHSLPYFFAVVAVYIGTTLPDIEGDRRTGKRTIGVKYGEAHSIHIIVLCYIAAIAFGFLLADKPFLYAALAALPFYLWCYLKPSSAAAVLAVKVSILTLSLVASFVMPLYLFFLVILVYLTRIYYRARFNMEYPSIK